MTLADVLKPSVKVLCHAERQGMYLGSTVASVMSIPLLCLSTSTVNPNDDPPLVAIANIVGIGGIIGATGAVTVCCKKLIGLDAAGIRERACKLDANEGLHQLDRLAAGGASVGVGLVCLRIGAIADAEKVSFGQIACTPKMAWETWCFAILGSSVTISVAMLGKLGLAKIRNLRNAGKTGKAAGTDVEVVAAATEAVEQIGDEVATATEAKAEEIVEAVKSAVETPAE